jgi:nicotinamidase-related amidase
MKKKSLKLNLMLAATLILFAGSIEAKKNTVAESLRISMQQRVPSKLDKDAWNVTNAVENWIPSQTAIIICDMWDKHWCNDATARVAEIAPAMNEILTIARNKGVKIVHAPSECMDFYSKHPARKAAMKYKNKKIATLANGSNLPSEDGAKWPLDQSDGGCENKECESDLVWTRQIETLTICDNDLISDSGAEIGAYFKKKRIKNVILVGVHTNMCVIGRSFGLRAMKRMGMNVVLMRDMTDLMYNHEKEPFVDHFSGLDLIVEYIETYVCPTIVSTDFTGKKQFVFKGDKRPRVAFLFTESEYDNRRVTEFVHDLSLKNTHCDFALATPADSKTAESASVNLENLQILDDAALSVFVRHRAFEYEKIAAIKNYTTSGRPILGVLTAQTGCSLLIAPTKCPDSDRKDSPDPKLTRTITDVSIAKGMEDHPVLKGVSEFQSSVWLYQDRPNLDKTTVLLTGKHPDVSLNEPIVWIDGKNVIYTSLDYLDDWKIESFRNLMFNSIDYLLRIK